MITINKEEWQVWEIERISPSRYGQIKQCLLREIWSANGKPNLLGNNPDAILGSLIHKILEKNILRNATPDFNTLWSEEENHFHDKFPDVFPLKLTARSYWTKRSQVQTYINSSTHSELPTKETKTTYKTELWVESVSGKIGGRIDLLRWDESGLTVIDFKTGKLYDKDMTLKKEYEIQMKLYAALCRQSIVTNNVWPVSLLLIDITGQFHSVDYAHEEAESLLEEAEATLDEINNKVRDNRDPAQFAEIGEQCTFCQFRPACSKYLTTGYKHDYLNDLSGIVEDVKLYRKENFKIMMRNKTSVFCTGLIGSEEANNLKGKSIFITHCLNQSNLFRTSRYSKIFIL